MIYLLILVVFLALVALILYNSIIRKKNDVENAFASVDVMLKKRYDLIPALVDAVKGYMNYERDLLTEITELRAKAISDIEFSEVTAKHLNTTQSSRGSKQEYIIIFSGVFVIADFNKHFLTHTLVLPDTAEKLFGKFGQTLQSIGAGKKKLVRLENPEFEKEFCVYADDQVEARYILTPALMERILTYKRKWKSKISLSFCDSKVYLAINMNKNLFETRIFRPVADYSFMEENLRFLILLTEIVEDLNLNTRIWTKE